jgi:CRISPR/Cas system CMR-associated protein Cmr5 small subunit
MQNLDQIRAKNALDVKIGSGTGGGLAIAKKIPTMIRENGFIAAMSFAKETGAGYADVFNAIIRHLHSVGQAHGLPNNFDGFLTDLCVKDSAVLRAVTVEAMAYLNYLRRFQG